MDRSPGSGRDYDDLKPIRAAGCRDLLPTDPQFPQIIKDIQIAFQLQDAPRIAARSRIRSLIERVKRKSGREGGRKAETRIIYYRNEINYMRYKGESCLIVEERGREIKSRQRRRCRIKWIIIGKLRVKRR